jgi:regulator of protease activity HflC (stomatin/prohibitin superfamily)
MFETMEWNSGLVWLGVLVIYLSFVIRWVRKPLHYVVEYNVPGFETRAFTWGPGLHFLWIPIPPLMFVREAIPVDALQPFKLQMGTNQGLGSADPVEFKDDSAGVDIQIMLKVEDEEAAIAATYKVIDIADLIERQTSPTPDETQLKPYQRAALNHVESYLRSHLGQIKLDDAIGNVERERIQEEVRTEIGQRIKVWGVTLVSVAITDFHLREETIKIRQELITATKKVEGEIEIAKGRITVATAHKEATIITAEGEAAASKLAGQGEADRLKTIREGSQLDPTQAAAYELARLNAQALREGNTTVVATSEGGSLSQLASMAGMVKGVFGGGNQTPPPAPAPSGSPDPSDPQTPLSIRRGSNRN